MIRPIAALILIALAQSIGGCLGTSTGENQQASVPAWEERTYSVDYALATSPLVTELVVNLTWLPDKVTAEVSAEDQRLAADHDLETGVATSRRTTGYSLFPWGADAQIPAAHLMTLTGESVPGYLMAADMIAPLWPVLVRENSFEGPWGEIMVSGSYGENWFVTARAPCQTQCGLEGTGSKEQSLRARGSYSSFLPEHVEYWFGSQQILNLTSTQWRHAADPVKLPEALPPPTDIGKQVEVCGLAPCEPEGLPETLSWQDDVDSIQNTPTWLAWSVSNPSPALSLFLVAREGPITVDGSQVADTPLAVYHFRDQTRARAELIEVADTAVRPIVSNWREEPVDPRLGSAVPPATTSDPSATFSNALDALGVTFDDVQLIGYTLQPPEHHPDVRAQALWNLFLYDGRIATMLVATGQLIVIQEN